MGSLQKSKLNLYAIEVAKWGLVIWLLLPIKDALHGTVAFGRVAAGTILFVIFAGKLLYDVVLFPRQHKTESKAGKDVLSMIGIVIVIALMVCLLVLFIAMYVLKAMNSNPGPA
ncbi:hypothetical protein MJD09_13455 [bacterium]|nr:hypothetical protein [bacterium]